MAGSTVGGSEGIAKVTVPAGAAATGPASASPTSTASVATHRLPSVSRRIVLSLVIWVSTRASFRTRIGAAHAYVTSTG